MTNHRLTDHIEMKEHRRLISLKPIMAIIKSRTLKLFGHIKRSQIGLSKLRQTTQTMARQRPSTEPHRRETHEEEYGPMLVHILLQAETVQQCDDLEHTGHQFGLTMSEYSNLEIRKEF